MNVRGRDAEHSDIQKLTILTDAEGAYGWGKLFNMYA